MLRSVCGVMLFGGLLSATGNVGTVAMTAGGSTVRGGQGLI